VNHRELGSAGVAVSAIGFGAWTIGDDWWGHIPDDDALRLLAAARDAGITLFDTAAGYGNGRSERLLGEAFAGAHAEVVFATKFGYDLADTNRDGHRERRQAWDPPSIRASLVESLRRLRTDVIDLLQLHNPKMDAVRRDDIYATLEDLKAEGKIRAWGAALGPRIGWRDEGIALLRARRPASLHMIYNLLEQDPGRDLLEAARTVGAGVLVRVPLSSGVLTGAYSHETTFPAGDHRSHRPRGWLEDGLAKIEKLAFLPAETGLTLAQASLRYLLDQPGLTSVLPTFRTGAEIREYAAAAAAPPLTADQHGRIAALYATNFGVTPASAAT